MEPRFLGLPLIVWGFVCLGVAVAYFFFWPKERTPNRTLPRSP